MNPWTGEIVAMASNPRFNPNTVEKDFRKLNKHPSKPFLNRAIQGALPPGSIFKVITTTAALSSNRITTQTTFECPGYIRYKNILFRCWSEYGHGLVTAEDAIPYSCNVFFFETAKMLPGETLYSWAKKFGIGEKTGIDLPHEKAGNIPKLATTASTMNVAIGQGALLTTPLQLARVYAAIANGGTLVQPHILLKITNSQGETVRTFQSKISRNSPCRLILSTCCAPPCRRLSAAALLKARDWMSIRSPVKQARPKPDVIKTTMPGLLVTHPMITRNTVLSSSWNTHRDMAETLRGLLPENL